MSKKLYPSTNFPIDISHTISERVTMYIGDAPIEMKNICEITSECPCKITSLDWSTHFLTHVDPPSHFVLDGKSLDDLPLDRFITDVLVVEVFGDYVTKDDVIKLNLQKSDSVLFKTRNSYEWTGENLFNENHAYISELAALYMSELKLNLVGFDYISIDEYGNHEYPAHKALLGAEIIVLEGLALRNVEPNKYKLSALPLKIEKGDGSPVRAVLLPFKSAE